MKLAPKLIRTSIVILATLSFIYLYNAAVESRNQELLRVRQEILEQKYSKFRDVYDEAHLSRHHEFWSNLTTKDAENYRKEWQEFVWSTLDRKSSGKKRGIVYTCHDGIAKLNLVSILMLRKKGCELPIEVWHYGNELGANATKHLTAIHGVTVKDLTTKNTFNKPSNDKMFEAKGAAIMNSEFDQILFLDSDVLFLIECSSNRPNLSF